MIEKNKTITLIIKGIEEKKGKNIVVISLSSIISAPCSFFVICSATSKTQIGAIAESIEQILLSNLNLKPWHQEGRRSNWRLMDYSDIVIHILNDDARNYYNIEDLWNDAEIKKIT